MAPGESWIPNETPSLAIFASPVDICINFTVAVTSDDRKYRSILIIRPPSPPQISRRSRRGAAQRKNFLKIASLISFLKKAT